MNHAYTVTSEDSIFNNSNPWCEICQQEIFPDDCDDDTIYCYENKVVHRDCLKGWKRDVYIEFLSEDAEPHQIFWLKEGARYKDLEEMALDDPAYFFEWLVEMDYV